MQNHLVRTIVTAAVLTVSAVTTTSISDAAPSGKQCPDGVLDDCFTKSEMPLYLEVAVDMVDDYLDEVAPGARPAAVVYIPTGQQVTTACTDSRGSDTADATAYQYCPVDDSVYIGQEELWRMYSSYGAISPVVGLAHEYGHFVQDLADVPDPANRVESIRHENQADCFAGAFARDLGSRGNLEYRKDLDNVDALMHYLGSDEEPGRTHGTEEERRASFAHGFDGGLSACSAYFPQTPLTA